MTLPRASLTQHSSIDEILDENAIGLLYFERFLPLVGRVPGRGGCPQYEQVCARYDEQRGLNLGALGTDADTVEAMSAVLGEQLEEQVQLRRVLQMRWHGEAGEAVQSYLAAEQQAAAELIVSIEDCHQTMCAAVDVLRDAVTDKALLIGGLDIDTVDGKDVDQIDAILMASGIECLPVDRESVFPRMASAFPDLAERLRSGDISDEFAAEVAERCRSWIETEFVPRIKSTCDAVIDACTSTDTAVRECLALVVDVMGDVHDPSFAELDDRSWAIGPGAEATGQPRPASGTPTPPPTTSAGYVAPEPELVGPTTISPTNERATIDAEAVDRALAVDRAVAVDNVPAGALGDSLDGLVDRLVGVIVDRVDEALDDVNPDDSGGEDGRGDDGSNGPSSRESDGGSPLPDDTAGVGSQSQSQPSPAAQSSPDPQSQPAAPPTTELSAPAAGDERGHLEAELDGHRARIALEHDGAVSLELETPGLGVRSFELRIGPFGLPEIVEIPEAADNADSQQAPTPAATLPAEPDPAPDIAESTPTEPPPTEPTPTDLAPAELPASDVSFDSVVGAEEQCLPESAGDEQSIRQESAEEPAVDEPPAAAHPVSADRSVPEDRPNPDAQKPEAGTGAGLSEAGTL